MRPGPHAKDDSGDLICCPLGNEILEFVDNPLAFLVLLSVRQAETVHRICRVCERFTKDIVFDRFSRQTVEMPVEYHVFVLRSR